jgi:hypothetical protein
LILQSDTVRKDIISTIKKAFDCERRLQVWLVVRHRASIFHDCGLRASRFADSPLTQTTKLAAARRQLAELGKVERQLRLMIYDLNCHALEAIINH